MRHLSLVVPRFVCNSQSVVGVQWRQLVDVLAQNVSLKSIKETSGLVGRMFSEWYIKHLVQFLQGQALSFGKQPQHQEKPNNIPSGIPHKGTSWVEGIFHSWPRESQNKVEEPTGGSSEPHTKVTNV